MNNPKRNKEAENNTRMCQHCEKRCITCELDNFPEQRWCWVCPECSTLQDKPELIVIFHPNQKMRTIVKGKVCCIVNGEFSYYLRVDGQDIAFTNSGAAQYFGHHYEELGYAVFLVNENDLSITQSPYKQCKPI